MGPAARPDPRHRDRHRRGNYAILVGLSASTLLGMGALAIDASYVAFVRAQAQAIADIGAHAALVGLRETGDSDDASGVAEAFVNANILVGNSALIDTAEDLIFGTWDFASRVFDAEDNEFPNAVQVTIRKTDDSPNGSFETLVMKIFGTSTREVTATAPAIGALRSREIFIVQDVTGSFKDEIGLAQSADLQFLDEISNRNLPNDAIGMVTFVGAAEVFTPLTPVATGSSSIKSQWNNLDYCDRNYYPWTVDWGGAFAHPTVAPMMDCNTGNSYYKYWYDSGTNQGAGLYAAIEALLTDGSSDPYALKVIILVSDGRPECTYDPADAAAEDACTAAFTADGYEAADYADDNNISIFAVSFNETYDATQSAYMEDLVRGYGAFYETPDENDLPAILQTIARSIPISLVH